MATHSRWIRLNIDWDEAEWLAGLPWPVRAVWPVLLSHVKLTGLDGRCKAPIISRFAAAHDIPEEYVTALLSVTERYGTLRVTDGEWVVKNWGLYQGKDARNAERQARHRASKKAAIEPNEARVTALSPVTLRYDRHATETMTVTESPSEMAPAGAGAAKARPLREIIPPERDWVVGYAFGRGIPETEGAKFFDYHAARGWTMGAGRMKNWEAAFRTWEHHWKERGQSTNGTQSFRDRLLSESQLMQEFRNGHS